MAASPLDLTTLANVKLYLGITTTAADDVLQLLITAASQYVATFCNRIFQQQVYTEVYDGTGTQRLVVKQNPIVEVTSVVVLGIAWLPVTDVFRNGFTFDVSGVLYGMGGYYFPRCLRAVNVTYKAGYLVPPFDLAEAVNEMVADKFKRRDNIGISARQIAGETISYTAGDVPKNAQSVLNLYQRASYV